MKAVGYYIALPFIWLLALLPLRLLYLFSDLVYLLVYRVAGYRKKVVLGNLSRSFPEKDAEQIAALARQFYHYLVDLLLENFRNLTFSARQMEAHCRFTPDALALFNKLQAQNRSAVLAMGHYGNWEWAANAIQLQIPCRFLVVYHPLRNPYFNALTNRMRARFGAIQVPMQQTLKEMLRRQQELIVTGLVGDQTPPPETAYWTTFLHQDTPFFNGIAKISSKLNQPVVFLCIRRVKRGYYEMDAEMLVEDPQAYTTDEITERYVRRLEADIRREPYLWLWSHRRWKHRRQPSA